MTTVATTTTPVPRYRIGDLVWVPWSSILWPAMVTYDPHQTTYYRCHGDAITHYHVQYFGILAQRGWVLIKSLKPVLTIDSNGTSKPKNKKLWNDFRVALDELKMASELEVKQRKLKFIFSYGKDGKRGGRGLTKSVAKMSNKMVDSEQDICEKADSMPSSVAMAIESDQSDSSMLKATNSQSLNPNNSLLLTPPSSSSESDSIEGTIPLVAKQRSKPSAINEDLCSICDGPRPDIICSAHCFQSFHFDCLGLIASPTHSFVCDQCLTTPTACFICRDVTSSEPLLPCSHTSCTKSFHLSCTDNHKGFTYDEVSDTLTCSRHTCSRCHDESSKEILISCIRCPLSFHRRSCLIAGCEVISKETMICYRHISLSSSLPQSLRQFNMNCCLHCGEAGSLVCCDFCSAAYHVSCLEDDGEDDHMIDHVTAPPSNDDYWLCPNCTSHDLPIYGSIVMVKCGIYRWWPAEIIHCDSIPDPNLISSKSARCMFLVRFYGSNQYYWTHHGRTITFTEDCITKSAIDSKKLPPLYAEAFEQALIAFHQREVKVDKTKESRSFTHIKRNKYLIPHHIRKMEVEPCRCTSKDPCSITSDCINRAIFTECDKNCPTGDACRNRSMGISKVPHTVPFHTNTVRGWGLKCKVDLKCGDFVIEYVGEVLDMTMVKERLKTAQETSLSSFYFLTLEGNLVIDARLKSNHARFINHSCNPNCETQKWTVNGETRIGIFAIQDIPADSELTFDYRLDSLGNDKKLCLCGAGNCSGFLGEKPRDKEMEKGGERKRSLTSKSAIRSKRRRKNIKSGDVGMDTHDDHCYICNEGGQLILCDKEDCSKVYHIECLNMDEIPSDTFYCPCHWCNVCDNDSVYHCYYCISSYCDDHHEDNIRLSRDNKYYICLDNCTELY